MSRCKNYLVNIPRFYKLQAFDHLMFGYVQGLRKALPSMKVTDAIKTFLEAFSIDEDVYCFDTARVAYYRMLEGIVEMSERGEKPNDDLII